mgnify:CR=1 FL=1
MRIFAENKWANNKYRATSPSRASSQMHAKPGYGAQILAILAMTENEFRNYFHELYPQLACYGAKLLGDNDVDDMLQVAFLELWHRRTNIAKPAHVRAFVFRSVYTQALNVLKHRGVMRRFSAEATEIEEQRAALLSPENCDVALNMAYKELNTKIETAISQLPPKSREAFTLSYLHDMKNKDIAQEMGISVRTVDAHIYNALRTLRTKLKLTDLNTDWEKETSTYHEDMPTAGLAPNYIDA